MAGPMGQTRGFLDDAGAFFGFCKEKIAGKGEDSCCFRFHEQGGIIAVFDGCGGSGAENYSKLGNHSGAYLASRAAAAATMQWFEWQEAARGQDIEALHKCIMDMLAVCEHYAEQPRSKIRGSITKSLPTTMAALTFQKPDARTTIMSSISAGDSHVYQLDAGGLKQLNKDDVSGGDAFSNLYDDPPMNNVISRDGGFTLNWRTYELVGKCVLISATDGCFGYLKSPMEFEMLLLGTLMASQSVDEWQYRIESAIDEVAGDDQTLLALAYGYRSFMELKQSFEPRFDDMLRLLSDVGNGVDDFGKRSRIWNEYRQSYYSLILEDGRYS